MDIIVTHVYDKERFMHYVRLKFRIRKSTALCLPNDINKGCHIKLTGIPECDVRYLQKTGYHHNRENPGICDLKILNNNDMRPRPSLIDISPQPGDELKQEPLELFHVKFTKVIHYDEMLNERQIQALLKDKHVKSINVEK